QALQAVSDISESSSSTTATTTTTAEVETTQEHRETGFGFGGYASFPAIAVYGQNPLVVSRADPIVSPGSFAGPCHNVFGASNFGVGTPGTDDATYISEYKTLRQSGCTTNSIKADMSNYWMPTLYYNWPNGTYTIVPSTEIAMYNRGSS